MFFHPPFLLITNDIRTVRAIESMVRQRADRFGDPDSEEHSTEESIVRLQGELCGILSVFDDQLAIAQLAQEGADRVGTIQRNLHVVRVHAESLPVVRPVTVCCSIVIPSSSHC